MAADPSKSEPDLLSREEVDELMERIRAGRKSPDVRADIDREFDRAADKVLSRGKLSGQKKDLVDKHVDKYMAMLKIDGERPDVRIAKVLDVDPKGREGGRVAGATLWHPIRPYTSVIRLPDILFKRPLQLENTIAHELVHHKNNLAVTDDEIGKWLETGEPPEWWAENDGHGKVFKEGADRINAIVGSDYVTEEGFTTKEEEEELQVSEAEFQAEEARAKKIDFGKQLLIGLGAGALVILALRKIRSRKSVPVPSPERGPSPEPGKRAPPLSSLAARQEPPATHRGLLPRMGSVPAYANERGSYGPPKMQRLTSGNERGSYG